MQGKRDDGGDLWSAVGQLLQPPLLGLTAAVVLGAILGLLPDGERRDGQGGGGDGERAP